jgi:hypothetical protein
VHLLKVNTIVVSTRSYSSSVRYKQTLAELNDIRDRSRHANVVTPARYSRRQYVSDRNPRSRSLSCTMTLLRHRTSLLGQTNDRRASVVRRS